MKSKALRLFAVVTLALLSANVFADGRHSGHGGYSHGPRYAHSSHAYVSYARPRPYAYGVGAYAPAYAPAYSPYYYDDYAYAPYVAYAPYPRYRTYSGYRPYPVYPARSGLVISAHIGIH